MLATMLDKEGIFVKVIDKDEERCRLLSEQLETGLVLCGDGTDIDLLTEEGVSEADCVICLTDDDKLNLLLALLGKHLGAKRPSSAWPAVNTWISWKRSASTSSCLPAC